MLQTKKLTNMDQYLYGRTIIYTRIFGTLWMKQTMGMRLISYEVVIN